MFRFFIFIVSVSSFPLRSFDEISSCDLCNFLLPIATRFLHDDQPELIEKFGIELCQNLHLADDAVCVGMIEEYTPVLIAVLRQSPLKTNEICGLAFNCLAQTDIPALMWNISIPPPTINPPDLSWNSTRNYSIVHLADLHIDWDYRPGSNADCGRPLCCRDERANSTTSGAAFWGDYRTCDLPRWTAESIFDYLVETESTIDWIYFTGDIAPHDVWQQNQTKDLEEISLTVELIRRKFPHQRIYPCVGNHESSPPDLFNPNEMSWLYERLAQIWIEQWGLDEQTRSTILYGGFYTTKITSKIRLISLNMNFCSENNYWLFINSTDPLDQLKWFVQWLQYAEDHDEKVHIIGHHPPRMCMFSFHSMFNRIVQRYQRTIAAQFFAHTHNDEFSIYYADDNATQPISISYITPSFTTYPNSNPSYRFYTIDAGDFAVVLDHRTILLNLTSTNLNNRTNFFVEYSARSTYELIDLSPRSWNEFLLRLENDLDGQMIKRVYQHYVKYSPIAPICDRSCLSQLINCHFRLSKFGSIRKFANNHSTDNCSM